MFKTPIYYKNLGLLYIISLYIDYQVYLVLQFHLIKEHGAKEF